MANVKVIADKQMDRQTNRQVKKGHKKYQKFIWAQTFGCLQIFCMSKGHSTTLFRDCLTK